MKCGVLVGDEPALKEALSCKGHAGAQPCLYCMNAVSRNARLGYGWHAYNAYAVAAAETHFSEMLKHTDEAVRETAHTLHGDKGVLGESAFGKR